MMALRTYRSISTLTASSLLLILSWLPLAASAQDHVTAEAKEPVDTTQVLKEAVEKITGKKEKKVHFINGVAVGADIVGVVMKVAGSDWSQLEVMARLNLLDKYFPIFEMGLGMADHEGLDIDNHFVTHAPYFRIGADYNFTKKHNGNRLFLGFRYGFSFYNFDLEAKTPWKDPIWKEERPVDFKSLSCNSHWGEIVFGLETRLWTIIHLGWDVRIKFRFKENGPDLGSPWYVPGFGRNDTSAWGGSFKILVDI